ncbi:MOSC domain-containing protein [Streptomonospora litoralis]|uniref:6-N-hydroxylaminopurine resistance protein n=1 Tax=Streptomonospora litoralis TaxID=2498135 RepID=A0A4P6PYR3_9ACTN|nr:MOSC domain-containing protein [Streptomonospora litoralis]QBI53305.1 6-N-hydroxylaminopurine resistance protein [Streptomonospora litoralis]
MPSIASVNTGAAVDADWAGRLKRTAIDKRPAAGPVAVHTLGLAGDEQADREHHGGIDKAVYAYAREDLDLWQERLGRPLRDGVFGENLTTFGIDMDAVLIGERWSIGPVLLEAALPRTPCGVFRSWMEEAGWVKRFTAEGRTGVYLRVLAEGGIRAGDGLRVVHRPQHGITVAAAFRARYERDRDLLRRVLEIPGRSQVWEEYAPAAGAQTS